MNELAAHSYDGHCDCGQIRYRMTDTPMFVHCCHCRWCQRETGASFALNARIESERGALRPRRHPRRRRVSVTYTRRRRA